MREDALDLLSERTREKWEAEDRAELAEAQVAALVRRIEAWIRHGEAVPADVTTYDREIVHAELRALVREVAPR